MRFAEFKTVKEDLSNSVFQLPLQITSSTDIANLQKILAAFEYPLSVTGMIDNATIEAVKLAHGAVALPPSGNIDPEFVSRLNSALTTVPEINDIMGQPANIAPAAAPAANPKMPATKSSTVEPVDSKSSNGNKIGKIHSKSALATDPKFLAKVDEVAGKLGIDPTVLMKIMQHESKLDPHAMGSRGNVGLIQFGKQAAADAGLSQSKIRQMDAISQMDLVYNYYKKAGVKPGMTQGDIYMLTFIPWAKNKDRNIVLGQKGGGHLTGTDLNKDDLWRANPVFANYAKDKGQNYYTKGDVIDYFNHYNA